MIARASEGVREVVRRLPGCKVGRSRLSELLSIVEAGLRE